MVNFPFVPCFKNILAYLFEKCKKKSKNTKEQNKINNLTTEKRRCIMVANEKERKMHI